MPEIGSCTGDHPPVETSGCSPLRALSFDVLGFVKVIEARGKQRGVPKVVDRWVEPVLSNCVLAASIDDRKFDPLLAIARKCGKIELLNLLSGDNRVVISNVGDTKPEANPIIGLHLFRRVRSEETSRSYKLLSCTNKGDALIRSFEVTDSTKVSSSTNSTSKWNVTATGCILCCKVDASENYALAGG